MKRRLLIFVFFFSFVAFAQNEVSKKVNALLSQKSTFKTYSPLTSKVTKPTSDIQKTLKKATLAKLNTQSLAEVIANKDENIEVQIPYEGETITLQLYKVNLFTEGFHVDTDKTKSISYEQGLHYRGIIKGDSNSTASFNFFKDEMNGIFSNNRFKNVVIGKTTTKFNISDYIIYSDADLKVLNNLQCHTKEGVRKPILNAQRNAKTTSQRCVTMYFEIDYNLFLDNNSNTTTTSNWMTSVFNNVQTLYTNDGINISLKSLYIWTTQDPYEGIGEESFNYLYKFNEVRPVFDGDLGQLIGEDSGSLGGVAATINGLCTEENFSYSDVDFSYNTVPTYSWTVLVITHEMGHLFGSPHTHTCVWNGDNTAIDGCGPSKGDQYFEGNCAIGSIPSTESGGTIMSYCHLVSGVGINLANGFGPQPAAEMLSQVNNASCLSFDCINTCINTVSEIIITNVSNTSATLSWIDIGSATNWEVSITPFTSSSNNWFQTTATNYTATNLLPNTHYSIKVRPVCDFGLISPSRNAILVTPTNYCSGVTIADTGGVSKNYSSLESYVRTIIPNSPDQKIRLSFTSFDLEDKYDYLYLHDGNSTSATDLSQGGFTGATIPGTFESTAIDGSLTLEFFSDQYEVGAGYVANVDCVSNLNNKSFLPNIDFTYYPNPSKGFVAITSKTEIKEIFVYNPQGRLLYQKAVNSLDTKVDMASFANGTYFFKLKFNEKEANFKIVKM